MAGALLLALVKSRPGGWQVAIKVVWRRRGVIRPTRSLLAAADPLIDLPGN